MAYEEQGVGHGSVTMPLSKFESNLESYLFMTDRDLKNAVLSHKELKNSLPFISHTNQLSNIDKKEAEVMALEAESAFMIQAMFTNQAEFNAGEWLFSQGLIHKQRLDLKKSVDGWFFKEIKERGRKVTLEEPEPEGGSILPWRR